MARVFGFLMLLATVLFTPAFGSKQQEKTLFRGEEPAVSPDGRWIAYRDWMEGNSEIFLAPIDGSAPARRITNDPGVDRSPAFSPDGARICFVSSRSGNKDLWVVEAAHPESPVRLTLNSGPDEDPAWSPDGKMIAYIATAEGRTDLFTLPSGGGEPTRITNNPDEEQHPTWSPDGRRIAFASDRQDSRNIWMIDFGASSERPGGTPDRAASGAMFHIYQLTKGNFDDSEPAWCPDGSVIAFSSNRKSDIGSSGLEAGTEKQRGNLPRVIFFVSTSPRPVLTLARGGFSILESPAWLPGGRNLVFVSSARPGTQSGKSEPSIHLLTGARN